MDIHVKEPRYQSRVGCKSSVLNAKSPRFSSKAFAVWMMTERSFHRKVNVLNGHSREGTDASASGVWQESRPRMQKALTFVKAFAVWTGLEPATPCVTGRYSNQLNYQTFIFAFSASTKIRSLTLIYN